MAATQTSVFSFFYNPRDFDVDKTNNDGTLSMAHRDPVKLDTCYRSLIKYAHWYPKTAETYYNKGKADAAQHLYTGMDRVFKHDSGHTSAIITLHNNPDYIAGIASYFLGKELTRIELKSTELWPSTAIAQYRVEGEEKPFLISHTTSSEAPTQSFIILQLKQLQTFLINSEQITDVDVIDYYAESGLHNFVTAQIPQIRVLTICPVGREFRTFDEYLQEKEERQPVVDGFGGIFTEKPATALPQKPTQSAYVGTLVVGSLLVAGFFAYSQLTGSTASSDHGITFR